MSTYAAILVLLFFFLNISHPNRWEVVSHCGFYLHFPNDYHLFIYLLAICMSSLEKSLFNAFTYFFNQVVYIILLLSCWSALYIILWILTSHHICVLQVFFPFHRLPFHSVDCFLNSICLMCKNDIAKLV